MAKLRQYLVAAIAALLLVGAIACDEAPKEVAGQLESSVSIDDGAFSPSSVGAREPAAEMFGKPVEPNQTASSDQDEPKQDQLEPAQEPQEPQAQNNRRSMSPTLSEPANAPLSTDTEAEGDPAANNASSGTNPDENSASSQEQSTGSSEALPQQQQQQQQPAAGTGARGLGLGQLISGMSNIMNQQQHQQHNGQFYQGQAPFEATRLQPQQQQVQLLPQQQEQVQVVQQQQDQQVQQVQQQAQQTSQVPPENLPTIIENNRVNQQSTQASAQQQQQQQQQAQQSPPPSPPQQQQQQAQQQSQPQQPGGNALLLPANVPSGNQTSGNGLAPSTGRTFGEGWTHCQGSSSGKYGTCKNDVNCKKDKGVPDGSCMSGLGVCCVMALTCGDKSHENNTFFANPDFPDPSWEARLCEVEIKKKHSKILQVMIEFEEFELAPPNHEGECITDVFQVGLGSKRPSPYSLLRICGQNTGQHLYLDVSQIDEPLVLSVATSGGGFPRRWSIRIVQMDEKNYLLAPPGCLQYYTDTIGHFRSFNLGRNLKDLYYAVCFRIDNGYSGIRFTSNFFGMNGPTCPRKKMHPSLPFHQYGGHYNQSFEAHPHHLVIPPPGYAMPPPRPYMPITQRPHQFQQQYGGMHGPTQGPYVSGQQRLKRDMPQVTGPMQPTPQPSPQAAAAGARTFDMSWTGFGGKEHKKEEKYAYKEEKKHPHEYEHSYQQHQSGYAPSYPPTYGPSYGPQQQQHGYGYSAPPQYYGHQSKEYGGGGYPQHYPQHPPTYGPPGHYEVYEHHGKKDDKYAYKDEKKEDKWGWKSDKKDDKWAWGMDKWGWKADKKDEKMEYKDDKYGYKSDKKDDKWWWKQEKKDDKYHESYPSYHQHQSSYSGYYGPPPPPNYYGGGEYHHKEIDKFGKKYEHLEHKHEKNHMDKEGKKDEKSWWFWQKKEDKKDKKEKYFTHHEALFPMMHIPEMPHCEPRFCGANDVITFPPSGDSISEMCGNRFNRGRGPKIISGSPLVVYVSNRGHQRGAGFDMNYEQVFYVPKPY